MPGAGDQPPGEDLLLLHLHQQDLLPPGLPHSALTALQTQEQVNGLLLVKNAAKFILYGPFTIVQCQLQTKATKEENHSPTHEDSSTEHQQQ